MKPFNTHNTKLDPSTDQLPRIKIESVELKFITTFFTAKRQSLTGLGYPVVFEVIPCFTCCTAGPVWDSLLYISFCGFCLGGYRILMDAQGRVRVGLCNNVVPVCSLRATATP